MEGRFYFYTKGLSVGYKGTPLIKNIEIGLEKGEILTLIGPNGAGKTTILKSIIRQLEPITGTAFIDGADVSTLSGNELAKKLSVVLTERLRPELMTCEDVVATGRYPYTGRFGVLSDEDRRIVKDAMENVQITEIADRDFSKTSDGQKQRVMLARALAQKPDVLIMDEPTSFLDIRYKLEFLSVIQKMSREQGLSVIMSLHELDLAERISDKVACVKGDAIDRFGPCGEIFKDGYIPSLYGLTMGSYNELSGSVEFPKIAGAHKVFVLGCAGTATPIYRKLQREGTAFAAGILSENDMDYPAAAALAAKTVTVPAFESLTEESIKEAEALISECERVICTYDPESDSPLALRFKGLYEYAKEKGISIVYNE